MDGIAVDFREVFKKRPWPMLFSFLLIVISAAFVTWSTKPVFESSGKIIIGKKDQSMGASLAQFQSLAQSSDTTDTQMVLFRSAPIAMETIKRADMRDPVTGELISPDQFLGAAGIAPLKGTDILQLSFQSGQPILAAQVVDCWMQVIVDDNLKTNREEATKVADYIEEQLTAAKKGLAENEAALLAFRRANSSFNMSAEADMTLRNNLTLETELRQSQAAFEETTAQARALRQRLGVDAGEAMVLASLSQNPTINRLRQDLVLAETAPAFSAANLTPDHPEVKQAQAKVTALRKRLEEEATGIVGSKYASRTANSDLDPIRQGLARDLIQAEVRALGLQTRLQSIQTTINSSQSKLTGMPEKELAISRLLRNVAIGSEQVKSLIQKNGEARILEARNFANARIIESATIPGGPIRPKKFNNMVEAVVGGLLVSLGLGIALEYLDDAIRSTDDARQVINLPILGIIPRYKVRRGAGALITFRDPLSQASEAYRALRTNLKFLSADSPLKTLVVTSSHPSEGKSTLVANLGISLAQTGKRVLIIDADLRLCSMHTVFDLPNEEGVSSILAGEKTFQEVIQSTFQQNLDLLTSGPLPPNPAELMESQRMIHLIETVKEQYDTVLFDSPPLTGVTDASILAYFLDGLIFVVGLNKVTRQSAAAALQTLQGSKIHVCGMVIQGARSGSPLYYRLRYGASRKYENLKPKPGRVLVGTSQPGGPVE